MADDPGHFERTARSFADQAERFDRPGSTLTSEAYLGWAVELLALPPGARVLDVATGTGLLAQALRTRGHLVTGLDVTPAMLARAAGRADELVLGEAERLPFPDGAFDAVTCRFGLHHFAQPGPALGEIGRVCRAGGAVGIVELLPPPPAALARIYNDYERRRDPSHVVARDLDELRELVRVAGLRDERTAARDVPVHLERWLDLAGTPQPVAQGIRADLVAEMDGGAPTGLRPRRRDGDLWFTQRWATIVARPPARTGSPR